MKSLIVLLLIVVFLTQTQHKRTNTTLFWKTALNLTQPMFQSFSGFQEIDWYRQKGTSGIYYQLFGARGESLSRSNANIPLIIWLNGGPGSSSMFGAFVQMGPIRINNNKPELFQYSWDIMAHMLFIDQPLNVGFSFSGNRTGNQQVNSSYEGANHLVNFLYNFYLQYPQLAASPLYITGQSYAGHYIPPFATAVAFNDTFLAATKVKLKGVAIGDGMVDPINQVNFYDSLLYSAGIVSNKFRDVCTWFQTQQILNIYKQDFKQATTYFDFLTNNGTVFDYYLAGMNEFNFRMFNQGPDTSFAGYLQTNKEALGVPQQVDYLQYNSKITQSYTEDTSMSYSSEIARLLTKTKVLIYNGQDDYVVNTAGVLNYLNSLSWKGIDSWKKSRKQIWTINNEVRGWAKTSGNLWFVLVNKAGHLVPTDQPESAFIMMGHFLRDQRDWKQ